jgi:nucleotide-binding universal stress UspA family protein
VDVALDVVSVTEVSPSWAAGLAFAAYAPTAEMVADAETAVSAEHLEICQSAAARLNAARRTATGRVLRGDAASAILAAAESRHADLIVVGTHGRTGVTRAVFGSVSRNVMLHATCSVLVVREVKPQLPPAA